MFCGPHSSQTAGVGFGPGSKVHSPSARKGCRRLTSPLGASGRHLVIILRLIQLWPLAGREVRQSCLCPLSLPSRFRALHPSGFSPTWIQLPDKGPLTSNCPHLALPMVGTSFHHLLALGHLPRPWEAQHPHEVGMTGLCVCSSYRALSGQSRPPPDSPHAWGGSPLRGYKSRSESAGSWLSPLWAV